MSHRGVERRNELWHAFLEVAPVGVAILDREMRYLEVSRRWLVDYRLEGRDVIGRSHYEVFPDIPEEWKAIHRRCLAGATERRDADRFPRSDGRVDWVRWEIMPWHDGAGSVGGIVIFSEVVTARVEMERALRAERDLNRHYLETADAIIMALDGEGRITLVNRKGCELFGRSSEELTGCNWFERCVPQPAGLKSLLPAYREMLAGGRRGSEFTEIPVVTPRGETRLVNWRSSITRDDEGRATGILAVGVNITERRQAEIRMQEQDRLLQAMSATAQVGGWEFDAVTREGSWTEEVARIHDLPADASINVSRGIEYYVGEHRRVISDAVRAAVERGEPYDLELMIRSAAGRDKWVRTIGIPVLRDGKVVRVRGTMQDITARKQAEIAHARSNRALRTLSDINQLLIQQKDEVELLRAACRAIVEAGGYRMAWVAYRGDGAEKLLTPVAWAGIADKDMLGLRIPWMDGESPAGPMGRALSSGRVQVVRDLSADPGFARWRDLAEREGYAALFAFPLVVGGEVTGVLGIATGEADAFDDAELALLTELGEDLAFGIEAQRTRAERDRGLRERHQHAETLRRSLEDSVRAIAYTVEKRDPYTAGHERRVVTLAVAIGSHMGLPAERIQGIRLAASVHDLGKIQIPAEILAKPGRLSDIEYMLIKTHSHAGYEILRDITFPWPIADIVHQHHERMDGSGYPLGLKGEALLLESRIIAVADVVEAMASHRPYRPAMGTEAALAEIHRGRGTAYDPDVVGACVFLFRERDFAF